MPSLPHEKSNLFTGNLSKADKTEGDFGFLGPRFWLKKLSIKVVMRFRDLVTKKSLFLARLLKSKTVLNNNVENLIQLSLFYLLFDLFYKFIAEIYFEMED